MSANSLSELRKSRGNFDTLLKQVEKMSTTTTESNDTGKEWKLSVDKGKWFCRNSFPSPLQGRGVLLGASLDTRFPRPHW